MEPDPEGRATVFDALRAFEALLDELVPMFCRGPDDTIEWPAAFADLDPDQARYERCEVKRLRIGQAADRRPDKVREHAAAVLAAVLHDSNPSGNSQLVVPLVTTLGRRSVQEALIERIRNGSDAEVIGAVLAWYWAAMPVRSHRLDPGQRNAAFARERADHEVLAELPEAFRSACLDAVGTRSDPEVLRLLTSRVGEVNP